MNPKPLIEEQQPRGHHCT